MNIPEILSLNPDLIPYAYNWEEPFVPPSETTKPPIEQNPSIIYVAKKIDEAKCQWLAALTVDSKGDLIAYPAHGFEVKGKYEHHFTYLRDQNKKKFIEEWNQFWETIEPKLYSENYVVTRTIEHFKKNGCYMVVSFVSAPSGSESNNKRDSE